MPNSKLLSLHGW